MRERLMGDHWRFLKVGYCPWQFLMVVVTDICSVCYRELSLLRRGDKLVQ